MTDPLSPFLSEICRREHLDPASLHPMGGGQINDIYVHDSLILRVARKPGDSIRLVEEARLLQRIREQTAAILPVPEILTLGEQDGRAYQLQRRLTGEKLHYSWPRMKTAQKERVLQQLGACLESLHGLTFDSYGWFRTPEQTVSDWAASIDQHYRAALDTLAEHSAGFSAPILRAAAQFLEENLPFLENSTPVLVHADLWPGNLLVYHGNLTGILDFEFACRAPRDYELVLIEDFCLYPNDFVEKEFETCSSADYADFFQLLMRNTPALFAIPHLRQRLDLYHVLFNLELYAGWRKANPSAPEAGYLLAKQARIVNMLFGHGARMFF